MNLIELLLMKLANKQRFLLIFSFIIISFLYFSVRIHPLNTEIPMGDDAGTILTDTYQMWQNKDLRLVGPKVLTLGYKNRYFFHGPYVYYFLLPGLLVGKWTPISGIIITILFNYLSIPLLFLIGIRKKQVFLSLFLSLIYSLTPFLVTHTTEVWNPNFLPGITILVIATELLMKKGKHKNFLLGLLFGIGLLLHYQFIVLFPLIFLASIKKKDRHDIFSFLGLMVGLLPILAFEIKNNFYSLRTLIYILQNRGEGFGLLPIYYFLAPLLYLLVMPWFLPKFKEERLGLVLKIVSLFSFCVLVSASFLNQRCTNSYYADIEKAANIIAKQNIDQYEVESNAVWEISSVDGKTKETWKLVNPNRRLFYIKRN